MGKQGGMWRPSLALCALFACAAHALDGQHHDVQLLGAGTPDSKLAEQTAEIKSKLSVHQTNWLGMLHKGKNELQALVKGGGLEGQDKSAEASVKATEKLAGANQRTKLGLERVAMEAGQKLTAANEMVAKAKLRNSLAADSPDRVKLADPQAWIKDADACEPVPQCLQTSMVNGGCTADKFPLAVCLSARKGITNLCKNSAHIQDNCCATCMLSQAQACMKEKLILAGFGADVDPSTVPTDKIHKFDAECEKLESKLQSEKSVPGVPDVANYQALAKNLYEKEQAKLNAGASP